MISPAAQAELASQPTRSQDACTACSGNLRPIARQNGQGFSATIRYCDECGGLDTQGLPYESTFVVVNGHLTRPTPEMEARQIYFNMEGPAPSGSDRPTYRRHGWYDPQTGALIQVG